MRRLHMLIALHSGSDLLHNLHIEARRIVQIPKDIGCNSTDCARPVGLEDSLRTQNVRRLAPCLGRSVHIDHLRSWLRQLHMQRSSRRCCHRLARALFQMGRADLLYTPVHSHSRWNTRSQHRVVARQCLRSKYHSHSCGNPLHTRRPYNHLHLDLCTWYMMLRKALAQQCHCTMSSFLLKMFQECNHLYRSRSYSH